MVLGEEQGRPFVRVDNQANLHTFLQRIFTGNYYMPDTGASNKGMN